MHLLSRLKVTCFLAIITFLAGIDNALADPAIWKINGKSNTVYLFGSIHVANKSMYPLGDKVDAAFKQSEVLVVEVDEAQVDQVKLQEIMMAKGFYGGSETIKDHVSEDTLKLLQQLLADTGVPYITVARMRPGIIALTLTVAKIVKMGYSPELGIDRYFMQQARGQKEVLQLESMEEQLDLLLSFSDDDLMLKHTLISLDKLPKMISDLINSWKNGDEKLLEKIMLTDQKNEYPEFNGLLKRLIEDRNVTMTVKIQNMLNESKDYFVVVGAGHLVGEKGIVAQLKRNGFSVQRH